MRKIENIRELHGILLDMAKAFHQICEEEGVPYFMLGGTQLGAVRHKGFIPWDDDMDFGVPRAYFEQIKSALKKKLPPEYSVYSREDGIVASGFMKIADNRTIHSHSWDENPDKKFGVNIDIFPLDKIKHKWKMNLIDVLMKLQGYKIYDASNRPWNKRFLAYFVKILLFGVSKHGIVEFVERYVIEKDGEYITNTFGVYGSKEIIPKDYFGEPGLLDFEDTKLNSVANPHEYLTHIYGDYMKLPPEDKQRVHILNMYWK